MALYNLIFKIDGEVWRTDSVEAGVCPPTPSVEEREGYDFSGWKNLPAVMPEADTVVEGSFTPDSFTLTAMVDDVEWRTATYSSGADISNFPTPRKRGYTFGGWVKRYKKMPKSNLTLRGYFKVNTYTLSFEIDGMIFENEVEYGTPLDFIMQPERDNHTFSGWGNIPETMPDKDVKLKGSFRPNTHTITFILEGEVLETQTLTCGEPIEVPKVPARDGAVFGGWRRVPDTMPNRDLKIEGKFRVKKYDLVYMAEDKKHAWASLSEGAKITLPDPPAAEGKIFEGWEGLPETMPGKNLTVKAIFREEA